MTTIGIAQIKTRRSWSTAHLTGAADGEIAREAGVRRVEPFCFSPRDEGEEARMAGEVMATYPGRAKTTRKDVPNGSVRKWRATS